MPKQNNKTKLPQFFKPLFWSYKFSNINPDEHKTEIIMQTINYGQLRHWKWIIKYYGIKEIERIVAALPITAFRPQDLRRFATLTGIRRFNYAPRAAGPKIRSFPPADYNWFSTSFEEILKKSEIQAKIKEINP